jgi:tRNA-specific 2-thiouridylase
MKNWDDDDGTEQCTSTEDFMVAARVCDALDIPLHTANFVKEYRERVFEHFLEEHRNGRTPNPDILCNKEIKFELCAQAARDLGADAMATGHYARIHPEPDQSHAKSCKNLRLLKGVDTNKDQSYFLSGLSHKQLENVLFPVGAMPKSQVRQLAKDAGLPTHDRPDSTGICFIGERHYQTFLQRYLPPDPGSIVDLQGNILGQHHGTHYYTIGQRRGLGIGGQAHAEQCPWYVVAKDSKKKYLVVAQGTNHPALFHQGLLATHANWIGSVPDKFPLRCYAKIRYRSEASPCIVSLIESNPNLPNLRVSFDQPQRAITPGQSVVFYEDDVCLGGAVIDTPVN